MFDKLRNWITGDDRRERVAALTLLLGSGVGLLASLVLSIESMVLARHSGAVLSCDLNSAISCSAVANHWSAELLGFPNAFIGLATLPVMVTLAVALLAKVKFPRWFVICALLGAAAGLIFAGWMLYMSVFEIQILCPWCLTLDAGMILIAYGLFRYTVLAGVIGNSKVKNFIRKDFDTLLLAIALVGIFMIFLQKLLQ